MTVTRLEEWKKLEFRLNRFYGLTGAAIVGECLVAVPSLIADVERLREALTKAADQFEFYAREHRTKAQACEFNGMSAAAESALAKALTNERFAAMCRAVVPEEPANG